MSFREPFSTPVVRQAGSLALTEIEMADRPRATQSLLARIKREAKLQQRVNGTPHHVTLESQARRAGFASWHELSLLASAPRLDLPVDPTLPRNFDCTANKDRSLKQLREWWDRPFALTCVIEERQAFEVRCLDGGAWDRSTNYGWRRTLPEARELAEAHLRYWQHARCLPFMYFDEARQAFAMQMRKRPDKAEIIVFGPASPSEVAAWIKRWAAANPAPPKPSFDAEEETSRPNLP